MISKGIDLNSKNLNLKIGKWEFQGQSDEPLYVLELAYKMDVEVKQWKVKRDYDEF